MDTRGFSSCKSLLPSLHDARLVSHSNCPRTTLIETPNFGVSALTHHISLFLPSLFAFVSHTTPNLDHSNVFAVDYRGFGLSSGSPNEKGLQADARTAWDYLCSCIAEMAPEKRPESQIGLFGHSLGGCIATELASGLALEGMFQCRSRSAAMAEETKLSLRVAWLL